MKRRWRIIIPILGFVYLSGPFIAGALEAGERRGPVFYPEGIHSALFMIGCEIFHNYKPREGFWSVFYSRAFFYGLPERPYPHEKRLEMIEEMRKKGIDSETLTGYIEMEAQITDGGLQLHRHKEK